MYAECNLSKDWDLDAFDGLCLCGRGDYSDKKVFVTLLKVAALNPSLAEHDISCLSRHCRARSEEAN